MKTLKYQLEIFLLNVIDRITLTRCKECDEITDGDICDYCIHN